MTLVTLHIPFLKKKVINGYPVDFQSCIDVYKKPGKNLSQKTARPAQKE
jgi:hypothetical protein